MRIIGGKFGGRILRVPKDLPVRPTTDFAKEGLFNILSNRLNIQELKVLDLFSGTGHIALEFASRGSTEVLAVDKNFKCIGFLRAASRSLDLHIKTVKSDVFDFLKQCVDPYDLIFADPPYAIENLHEIHLHVFERRLLSPGGLLIIEHGPKTKLEALEHFLYQRKYGNVNFSFFQAAG
jgi:16S rRNA (guanine(966)-N(2))-methyltransferase RsmD